MPLRSCSVGTVDLASEVQSIASQLGVPPEIALAVAQQESGVCQYNADGSLKRGSAGEIGVMQLMPATAAALGVNPADYADNIRGGVLYLKQNYARFGSWPLAIAAYNAGPGNVAAAGNQIPAASAAYVAAVLAFAGVNSIASAFTPSGKAPAQPGLLLSANASSSPDGLLFLVALAGIGLWIALD